MPSIDARGRLDGRRRDREITHAPGPSASERLHKKARRPLALEARVSLGGPPREMDNA